MKETKVALLNERTLLAGVLIVSLLDYDKGADRLLFLDARSMTKIAEASFPADKIGLCIPEADHGVFISAL